MIERRHNWVMVAYSMWPLREGKGNVAKWISRVGGGEDNEEMVEACWLGKSVSFDESDRLAM